MHQKQPPAKVALARRAEPGAGLSCALDPAPTHAAPAISPNAQTKPFHIDHPPRNSIAGAARTVPRLAPLPVKWPVMTALDPFHPAVRTWFTSRLGQPTAPQLDGWPLIREGRHTLIAAPTGS